MVSSRENTGLLRRAGIALMLATSALLANSGHALESNGLEVTGYAREMPPGAVMGAAYLVFRNGATRDRRLLKVELPGLPEASAALHTTVMENGVSRMRSLAEITLPQNGHLEMQPGATHLMLRGVQLKAGEQLALRLLFADGEALDVQVPVRADVAADNHHHHHG